MVSVESFTSFALSFQEAVEAPHFEKNSFRVRKKIFATLNLEQELVVVKLNLVDQSVFCGIDSAVIYPVEGAWGKQGWTKVELKRVEMDLLRDILTVSYCTVAPKKLAAHYQIDEEG